jgi:hypothetical protein
MWRPAPAPRRRGAGKLRGRFRRKPLLVGVLTVGVLGGFAIFALQARPDAAGTVVVPLGEAYVGTAYAFDGTLCLGSPRVAATVVGVEVTQAPGGTTQVLEPEPGARPVVGFPVDADGAGRPVSDYRVPAGEQDCTLRVLVTPEEQGTVRAGTVEVEMAYGPFGLLRRTATAVPKVTLDVTGTGTDPRTDLQ